MFEWSMDLISNVTTLVRAAIVLIAILMVVMVYARTRGQLVATAVGAALPAGGGLHDLWRTATQAGIAGRHDLESLDRRHRRDAGGRGVARAAFRRLDAL
jgi:hypothetical protein